MKPPILPMLAKAIGELPVGGTWIFEPKWDGFRALVFRDRDEILIQSRDGKSLNRYFPELLEPLRSQLPDRCVLDGEIVVARNGALDFDALQLRIHPAASRVKLLHRTFRRQSYYLISSRRETRICGTRRSASVAEGWNRCFYLQYRQYTYARHQRIKRSDGLVWSLRGSRSRRRHR